MGGIYTTENKRSHAINPPGMNRSGRGGAKFGGTPTPSQGNGITLGHTGGTAYEIKYLGVEERERIYSNEN